MKGMKAFWGAACVQSPPNLQALHGSSALGYFVPSQPTSAVVNQGT
jgi:hypothetical protein